MKAACRTTKRKTPADFREASEVFKALSNPNRLLIVDAVAKGERCVADLTELVGLDMSTVSNHLSVLRNVGILKDERRGTQVFYSLRKPCLLNVFCCLDEFHAEDDD
jgi:DNA-binding transcriptional ArsR family regulator